MQENSQPTVDFGVKQQEQTPKKEKAKAFNLAIFTLIIVVIIGAILTGLNWMTNSKISSISENINQIDNQITEAKKQKTVIITSMIEWNNMKESINLKKLVADFKQAWKDAGVQFQGFNVKNDTITTNLISRSSTRDDAVVSIIKMMQNYEKNNTQKSFALDPILTISGTPQNRTTPVTFKIISKKETENNENTTTNN